jgi:2-C-methyl-D-erythritol 4-phosphate cytidylyltransferase
MSKNLPPTYVVIPAAGIGSRMQSDIPKQYLTLFDKPILEHTIERFIALEQVVQIVVALHPQDNQFKHLACARHAKVKTVNGGKERADSVLAGLRAIQQEGAWVMVHDAARPCLNSNDINNLLLAMSRGQGAILATRVRDTMKRSDNNSKVISTENRDNLWHALTPQCFAVAELTKALEVGLTEQHQITDEASAIELAGGSVLLIEGSDHNIKITRPDDLSLAAFYLRNEELI